MSKFYGGILLLVLGSIALTMASVVKGPDRDLHFAREIPSKTSAAELGKAITDIRRWPEWFFALQKAEVLDGKTLEKGAKVTFFFNDKKSPWSHMEITCEVLDISPSHIAFAVLSDSKKKLDTLFDRLEWEVTIQPDGKGSLLIGKGFAHTATWRSRLVGAALEKVLMSQVYYPNLIQLAEVKPSGAKTGPSPLPELRLFGQ